MQRRHRTRGVTAVGRGRKVSCLGSAIVTGDEEVSVVRNARPVWVCGVVSGERSLSMK